MEGEAKVKYQYGEYIERVDKLSSGDRAALRQSCGQTLDTAGGYAMSVFYSVLPWNVSKYDEEGWFEAACLRCMWRPDEQMTLPLEQALGIQATKDESDVYRDRLVVLLDTPTSERRQFALKLWRLVRLMKSKGYVIDCAALIKDIVEWDKQERYTQRKWARAFSRAGYVGKNEKAKDDNMKEDN